jgi:mRNA interferase MazF
MSNGFSPQIGEVYLMRFGGTQHEQTGVRPGLVIQNNVGNKFSPNVIALPLTTSIKKLSQPTHVLIKSEEGGLMRDSIVLCEGPERMSKTKVGSFITRLSKYDMSRVARAHILSTSIISFLSIEELTELWYDAVKMNNCC